MMTDQQPLFGQRIEGFCPMGCGETLYLAAGSFINCNNPDCPRPSAVAEVLADDETDHVIEIQGDGFQLMHPLRERLDDGLFECTLHKDLVNVTLDPPPGRYRVFMWNASWKYEALS